MLIQLPWERVPSLMFTAASLQVLASGAVLASDHGCLPHVRRDIPYATDNAARIVEAAHVS